MSRTWYVPFQDNPFGFFLGIGYWNRRKQGLGIGMLRVLVNLFGVCQFNDFAQVHYRYLV